jgi:putative ABC transport system substrate-binding protein
MIRTRRSFMGTVAVALASPSFAWAQGTERVARVVVVRTVGQSRMDRRDPPARARMREWHVKMFAEKGFVEGRNLALDIVDLDLPDAEAERLAREIVAKRPDAILVGDDRIPLFKSLTTEVPLVFYQYGGDPVLSGIVPSYARPGGNVTGTALAPPGAENKGWEILKELRPSAKRLGVVWNAEELGEPWAPGERKRQSAAAARMGLECIEIVLPAGSQFPAVERAIRAAKVDLLDATSDTEEPWVPGLMRFVERTRLPTLWTHMGRVREGGLLSANPDTSQAYNDAIDIVVSILHGAKPATIPVRAPTRFVTAINMRTARAMGLQVPPSVLVRVTRVIDN